MARSRVNTSGMLDADHYTRGPTGARYDLPSLMVSNPAFRWFLSSLVSLAILVPLVVIFWDNLLETFGIAIAPVGLAIPIALWIAYKLPPTLITRANRWLALVALGALLFGILAFFRADEGILANATLGGDVGTAIIGDQDAVGVLRLIGIGLATVALIAPAFSWRASVVGTILLIRGTVLMSSLIQAGFNQLRERYERRQIRGWLGDMSTYQPRRAGVGDILIGGPAYLGRTLRYVYARLTGSFGRSRVEDRMEEFGASQVHQNTEQGTLFRQTVQPKPETEHRMGNIGILEPPGSVTADKAEAALPTVEDEKSEDEAHPKRLQEILSGPKRESESSGWGLPPIDLLDPTAEVELKPADHQKRAEQIGEALASHGIEAKIVQINPGPTVTQFGVEPGWFRKYKETRERDKDGKPKVDRDGNPIVRVEEISRKRVKVDQIAVLDKDLALALAAPSIRIEAPVPGKPLVGIEVPNISMGMVGLRGTIESPEFQKLHTKTKLALGKGSAGEVIVGSLEHMPHLLIAGATGSGKSVCITSLISCLLMHNTPRDLQLVIIDPKRVELATFGGLPHLLTPVIVDMGKVVSVLKGITQEMDRRYKTLASAAARNIQGYNKKAEPKERMPHLVVVIDELADLMSLAPYDVEQALTRLAQMGRATGIHLIVATQRPSVDVITGLIKANFPTRISFAVTSMIDSRVILDTVGAEKLLGQGDMLYLPSDASKPRRLQGVFVSEQEVGRIVYFWGNQKGSAASTMSLNDLRVSFTQNREERDEDPFLTKARDLAMHHNSISTSLVQRRLSIGYPRAARLIDQLEEEGVVGPGEPGKSRKVLKQQRAEEEMNDG